MAIFGTEATIRPAPLNLAGTFGAINYLFLKLPSAIGILIVALLASLTILFVNYFNPQIGIFNQLVEFVDNIEFSEALLEGMLAILLFAGALHIKITDLKLQIFPILLMATIANIISKWIKKYKWIGWGGLFAILAVAVELIYSDLKIFI